jgi:hypothetical protein
MNSMVERAQVVATTPEIVEAMKILSKHGLGVCMPHAHDGNGNFIDLAPGVVGYEENLKVSFHTAESAPVKKAIAVGWRWNPEKSEVEEIQRCAAWC